MRIVGLVVAGAVVLTGTASWAGALPTAQPPRVAAGILARLPQSFEANVGQAGPDVEFLCRGAESTLLLNHGDAVLAPHRGDDGSTVRLRLAGKARHPRGEGRLRRAGVTNYLLGADPRYWHTGVPNYGEVRYPEVFRGVDLIYRGGDRRHFEYDFVVAPGADPGRIRLAFDSAPSGGHAAGPGGAPAAGGTIHLGPDGELIVPGARGDLVEPAPIIYQEAAGGGGRLPVAGRYVLLTGSAGGPEPGRVEVGFAIDAYDPSRPLVIDPQILYSSFLGGNGQDVANGIAVDTAGNAYVVGTTYSTSLPGVGAGSIQPPSGGAGDVFLLKIDAAGTGIVYSTFLGGSAEDDGHAIAVDAAGNAYLTGDTYSTAFPGVSGTSIQPAAGGGEDAFLTKVNAAGNGIVYSTFLGGSGDDSGYGIALDSSGNAYVAGSTGSATFPGVTGSSIQPDNAGGSGDAFLAKVNAAGTAIAYATFLGGSGPDSANAVAVDAGGNAYLAGFTESSDLPGVTGTSIQPAYGGNGDAFVVKVNAVGTAIVYATFLGDFGSDAGTGIGVDAAGNAYVVGATDSPSFPGVGPGSLQSAPPSGGGMDAFVTKINPAGTAIVYSTFLGGTTTSVTDGNAIAVDRAGDAWVTGSTDATSLPWVGSGAVQHGYGGGGDAFLAEIDPTGTAIVDSTYLGGGGNDEGFGIAVDGAGSAYVAGSTSSSTFPGVSGSSIQPANAGGLDAFVIKISNRNADNAFYTLAPCRVFDTRNTTPLGAGEARRFQVSGACGVPNTAKAVAANVTVVAPQQPGFLTVLPGNSALDLATTSNINFKAGQVRANNAIVLLSSSGTGTIDVVAGLPSGTTHVVLDVVGYFQ